MTPQQFISKWRRVQLSERSACQQHFLDLCELLDQPKPADADPDGTFYTFERGVRKCGIAIPGGAQAPGGLGGAGVPASTGGIGVPAGDECKGVLTGWADVWKRGHFGWEYKGKHKDLEAAYEQLLRYREDLENPPLLVVCDMDRFEIHTNFTGTVKRVYAFDLASLPRPENLETLRKLFTDPQALRPDRTSVRITEQAAAFSQLADGMRQRGVAPDRRTHAPFGAWVVIRARLLRRYNASMSSVATKNAPSIRVPLSGGNIRNAHVYVKDFLWFFPKAAIVGERTNAPEVEPCELVLPDLGVVESEIDARKGIFRWRGWRRFFRDQQVQEGDHIVFTRERKNRFRVAIDHGFLAQPVAEPGGDGNGRARSAPVRSQDRCNDLSGDEWLRYSVSVWSDIRKTSEEAALGHPAMFPAMLCERLAMMFLRRRGKHRILDPFMGSGSTLVAARNLGKVGIGLDISDEYIALAKRRLSEASLFRDSAPEFHIHKADARSLLQFVDPCSIDLCITSPPYWDILNQARTADNKATRHYGNLAADLGTISDYDAFVEELKGVFFQVHQALRPGAYCAVVVMDLRKKSSFFSFHSDLAKRMCEIGFLYDDLVIWDRRHEYNNLRPLGYPAVFRVNKIHEFVLLFQRPR